MINSKKIILFIGDTVLLYVALWLTLRIRYWGNYTQTILVEHFWPFTLVFALWLTVFFINDLYSVRSAKNSFRFYGYLVQNQLINTALAFAFFYLVPESFTSLRPQTVLVILLFLYTLLFVLWRSLFYALSTSSRLTNTLAFIGVDKEVISLCQEIQEKPQLGYKVGLIINLDGMQLPDNCQHIPVRKDLINLKQEISTRQITTVVTISDPRHSAQISKYLFDTIDLKLQYFNFPDFYESLTGKIPTTSIEKTWFLQNISQGSKTLYELVKRAEDIIMAVILGIVALPFVVILLPLIKLESPGSAFFTQIRTGRGGKNFTAIKFRSMRHDAEVPGQAVWAQKSDPRVTRIGKIMRASRLDEIPQIINILKGDMSFVGPRPERPEFIKILGEQIPYYNERLLVKPGLTGWAQINYPYGSSIDDAMVKLQYDLFYIKNRSFTLDISIILKTINTVLNRSLGQ
jgi:exopolysaccharide biosynthesis polyprenyl glycosylphosphotransferase